MAQWVKAYDNGPVNRGLIPRTHIRKTKTHSTNLSLDLPYPHQGTFAQPRLHTHTQRAPNAHALN